MTTLTQSELGREFCAAHPNMIFARGAFWEEQGGQYVEVPELNVERAVWTLLEHHEKQGDCKPSVTLVTAIIRYAKTQMHVSGAKATQLLGKPAPTQVSARGHLSHGQIGEIYCNARNGDTMYSRGQWYRWNGNVWDAVDDSFIHREIWRLLVRLEASHQARANKVNVNGVMDYCMRFLAVDDKLLDANPDYINLWNGTYSLDLRALLTPQSFHYLTTRLPFSYDPDAECPTWMYYVQSTFTQSPTCNLPDQELIDFVQEAMGYSLTTDVKYHVSFWCLGEGENGKGVLFHVLSQLAGPAQALLDINSLKRNTYQLAGLAGKRIAMCSEVNTFDNVVEDATFKQLVAGDPIPARQIYERSFTLYPTAKLWQSMNRLPAVADTSHGFWRRVRLIPFNRIFADHERIPNLKQLLELELSGIFNWAIQGLDRLQANGDFTMPKQVEELTKRYKYDSNVVLNFVDDECVRDANAGEHRDTLYSAYVAWCRKFNYKPYNVKNFRREMEALGFHVDKNNVYHGLEIALKPTANTP